MRGLVTPFLIAAVNGECTGDEDFDSAVPTCNPTEFTLSVDKCAFENARFENPEGVYMAGPDFAAAPVIDEGAVNQCVPTLIGNNYVFNITGDIEECGTSVTTNSTHVTYENAVQSTIGSSNDVITRQRKMKINFSCFFELEVTLSLTDAINPRIQHFEVDVGVTEGVFDVSMGLFTDDTFGEYISGEYTIQVPEKLHVGVVINDDTSMILQLEECWATPSSDHEDPVRYPFIENMCGDEQELNVYKSLVISENGVSQRGLYSIESFSFNGQEDGEIYLHCAAVICDPSNETCAPTCPADGRRRRSASGDRMVTTSVGPVSVNV